MHTFRDIGKDVPADAVQGAAVSGQVFAALYLDYFVVRIVLLNLFHGQRILLGVQARYKDTVFYLKKVKIGPGQLVASGCPVFQFFNYEIRGQVL